MKNEDAILVRDLMGPPPMVIREEDTVERVIQLLRQSEGKDKILYFYVVNSDDALVGVLPTRSILLAQPDQRIRNIAKNSIFFLHENTPFQKAMESLSQHRLLALPVVNPEKKVVGFFDIKMCFQENEDLCKADKSQEIFQLLGIHLEMNSYKHPFDAYRKRMPWIFCNMVGGVACAIISFMFKMVLTKIILLAMFIPLVLALSESISMQSMTQSLQITRKQKTSWKKMASRIFLEMPVAGMMSITSGLIVGFLSLCWKTEPIVSVTIGLGIAFSVMISSMIGACVPFLLHISKLDPKVASGPVVLTLADMVTTGIYLSFATYVLA